MKPKAGKKKVKSKIKTRPKKKPGSKKRGNPPGSNGGGGPKTMPDPFTNDKELERLKEYARSGIRNDDIAALYGMGKSKFYQLMKSNPAIRIALDEGRARALFKVGKSLFDKAMEGDLTAQIFYLKTQGGWRDKTEEIKQQGMQSVRIILPGQNSEQVVSIGPSEQITTIDAEEVDNGSAE